MDVAGLESHAQEHPAGAFKDKARQVHVLVVEPVEQGELLMPVAGIVGGVDVENQPPGALPAMPLEELLDQEPIQLGDVPGGDGVLEAAQGRLAGERRLAGGGDLTFSMSCEPPSCHHRGDSPRPPASWNDSGPLH
jgi:hypothetical protein